MNAKLIKQVLKYLLLLAVSLGLFWFALRGFDITELASRIYEVEYSWVLLSLLAGLISYLLRAYRWNLMLKPLGYTPSFGITFNSLMVGYMANFALPRFGEVARCGVLRKNAGVPIATSFGTVLAERALDFIILLLVVAFTLVLEFNRLKDFLDDIFSQGTRFSTYFLVWAAVAAAVLLFIGIYLWRLYHLRLMKLPFYQKIVGFGNSLISGLLSIRNVKEQGAFWASTILIWVMYYLMTYVIVLALPHISNISLLAGLSLLAMGGIGMAAPVMGGIGSYHILIRGTLIIYGISFDDATFLALLMHTSQSLFVIILGAVCLVISLLKGTKALQHETKPA